MWAPKSQCFSLPMNIWQLWQLKKLRFFGPFWSYQPESAANSIQPIYNKKGPIQTSRLWDLLSNQIGKNIWNLETYKKIFKIFEFDFTLQFDTIVGTSVVRKNSLARVLDHEYLFFDTRTHSYSSGFH